MTAGIWESLSEPFPPFEILCRKCGGDGVIEEYTTSRNAELPTREMPCPACRTGAYERLDRRLGGRR